MPLLVTAIAPESVLIPLESGTSLVFLTLLGGLAARAGGAGATRRTAQRPDLLPQGPDGVRPRPFDQGDGRKAHAGATGLDL